MNIAIVILITRFLTLSHGQESVNDTIFQSRKNLISKLLLDYDKALKPPGRTDITIDFILYQIVNLLEKEQVIVLCVWLNQKWFDSRFVWDPLEYSNINYVLITSDKLWM